VIRAPLAIIVSMTHKVSDLLEVLLLAKEVDFWRYANGHVHSALELVPLFETIDDLNRIGDLMARFRGSHLPSAFARPQQFSRNHAGLFG
jgi:phosphoenolpyruvate carboxylase